METITQEQAPQSDDRWKVAHLVLDAIEELADDHCRGRVQDTVEAIWIEHAGREEMLDRIYQARVHLADALRALSAEVPA